MNTMLSSHQNIMYKGHIIETCYNEWSCSMFLCLLLPKVSELLQKVVEEVIEAMKQK